LSALKLKALIAEGVAYRGQKVGLGLSTPQGIGSIPFEVSSLESFNVKSHQQYHLLQFILQLDVAKLKIYADAYLRCLEFLSIEDGITRFEMTTNCFQ